GFKMSVPRKIRVGLVQDGQWEDFEKDFSRREFQLRPWATICGCYRRSGKPRSMLGTIQPRVPTTRRPRPPVLRQLIEPRNRRVSLGLDGLYAVQIAAEMGSRGATAGNRVVSQEHHDRADDGHEHAPQVESCYACGAAEGEQEPPGNCA